MYRTLTIPVFLILLIFSASLLAQDTVSVNWTLQSTQTAVTSGSILGYDETFDSLQVAYDASAVFDTLTLTNIQKFKPEGTGAWPADTGKNVNRYIQFTVAPKIGFKLNITRVMMFLGAKGSNNIMASVYYSTDSSFAAAVQVGANMSLPQAGKGLAVLSLDDSINEIVDAGQKLYLRVYPWNSTGDNGSTSKYIYIQNVTVAGHSESIPTPSAAAWPLTDPAAGGTGLSPVTSGGVKAEDELLMNTEINHYTGPDSSQRVRILGNSWPANQTTQIDSVYIEFEASPKFGGQFDIDSISLKIGASSLNNMKANIYYSTDSLFTSSTLINYSSGDTSVNNYILRDTLVTVAASLSEHLNTGESIFLRIYPWVDNESSVKTGKYIDLKDVVISGLTMGATVDLPEITTTEPVDISTTFATSGGNISTDGGATVTARGVVWDTTSNPTISNNKTTDGTGTGAFNSYVTLLTPGTKYYLRAYATNAAGTSYGEEFSFTTLDSTMIPVVTTSPAVNILVKSAESGGQVTAWGGDTVTARGVVWNKTGNPTLSDNKTVDGSGTGSFASTLYPLEANTTYYVRAYATNSKGTGYGSVDTFLTQTPAPKITKVVAKDGTGDYTTVQAAFNDVPDNYTGPYIILVKKGTYKEKLLLPANKINVILVGEERDSTILTYDDYAGIAGGTSGSYSVGIDAADFTAMNITLQNTYKNDQSVSNQQAVALRSNGDRQAFYNCNLLGYQDTYYAWGGSGAGRVYMKNCYIEGSVDFIFGRDIVLFDSCELHVNRNQCSITAASTDANSKFGLVFKNCVISNDSVGFDGNAINKVYLGRAWQNKPRTVFMNTYEPSVIDSLGWNQQPINAGVIPAIYGVYEDNGPGYNAVGHGSGIGTILTGTDAADYTLQNIFSKSSNPGFPYDWMPSVPVITGVKSDNFESQIPDSYRLYQNYPNPFNPSTTIRYSVPQSSHVKIVLYDILGKEVATLVNEAKNAGNYKVMFNASSLASGVYFYRIESGNFVQVKKMMLLK